ncbi:hypothetical protein LTR91_017232 [Friedmanniomyces endolithicus]|uniref:Nucleolar complex-associated protein 3 n=1 Tax=Friedmanniomyces endolithicus TaxID=329885 RepID=A0AAN6K6J4_9PEZI|nr:hypothetical protein LTR75_002805 [Friedmanniomyces endolithicus]KAK0869179.1 hypothetical protein LTS02_003186 [Friedmanniomyces endolithicus]KAK0879039.1 hypothetical protein LTR87_007114 [Friedmanniomyces endolithicus]KAK0908853.1 hypothetical protein LTR57_016619 [Friedmanniomyces endolithicus]KAK0967254.1 hypothetical protein LTR91_017232 [Friedmanniomyces endolithicus]
MAVERNTKRRRLSPPNESKTAVPGFAQWDIEQNYEQRSRKGKKDKSEKLLVRTTDGWKENQRLKDAEQKDIDEDADSFLASGDEAEDSGVADVESKAAPKPLLSPKEHIRQAKEDMARIAGHVSEDPEENIAQLSQLGQLAQSENLTVKKLALGTQLATYKDIIPGYRIRPQSREDMQAKVSKDVRKLRDYEQTLLTGYKEYVQMLSKLAGDSQMSGVAIACATTLLTSVPHFNCRNELIALVVRKLSTRNLSADGRKCAEALEQLFRDDEEGHASLEAVGQLTRMMKGKNFQINEIVLNTFLHLRLLSEFTHKASTNHIDKDDTQDAQPRKKLAKKDREHRTKRERKVMKERKVVAKEMQEADAVVSYEDRDKNQAETLKLVFVAYFRILKAKVQHLMGAVLEGLAKYSHLINQDFFGDVLEVLKDLISEAEASLLPDEDEDDGEELDIDAAAERNVTRESLLCIITAFALLQGQHDVAKSANTLSLDLNFFITHLYRTLLPSALNSDIELSAKSAHLSDPNGLATPTAKDTKVNVATTTVLLLRSLHSVLLPPTATKSVPPVRIAAFTKQLMSASLHLPQKSTIAVLSLLREVTKTHAGKVAALWNTEERRGDGVFDATGAAVESSNPFAATVWEGELLRLHFDPRVREAVLGVEQNVIIKPEGR